MIRYLSLFIFFIIQTGLAKPSLYFERADRSMQNYKVKRLDIKINVVEDLTYTTITADFLNTAYRNQEAELIIPLSKNATICEYAIDVNGKMKNASVVEKKRALNAYESIKARNVDPGIVEKKANNIYRIRVFPLLHEKEKRLKISYVTKSEAVNGFYRFSLPIKLEKFIDVTHIKITTANGNSIIKSKHLGLDPSNKFTKEVIKSDLTDTIEIVTPVAKTNTAIVRNATKNNQREAYYKIIVPDNIPLKKLYQPTQITMLWNNSAPFSLALQQQQLKLLDLYFKHNPNTSVQLYAIGYDLQDMGIFKVESGNWATMKKAITGLSYEGALDVSCTLKINPEHLKKDVFMFSPQFLVRKLEFNNAPDQLHLIDCKQYSIAQVLAGLCYQRLRPFHLGEKYQGDLIHDEDSRTLQFIAYGVFNDHFSIGYEYEKKDLFTARFSGQFQQEKIGKTLRITGPYLGTLLARHQLENLIRRGSSEREIVKFASKHRLVSDFTSMIVLETMNDHVRYKIPPRDSQELAKYLNRVQKISGQPLLDYNKKLSYHAHRFAWHNYPFKKAGLSIDIWEKCLDRFFLPKQIDQKSYQHVMQWKKRVEATNFDLQSSKTQREFTDKLSKLKKLDDERKAFFNFPSQFPKDKKITVSLRGVVKEPRNYTIKAGTDLKEFTHQEDTPWVDVYRNSQRYSFNLYSKKYKKTPLQSGDMLVVKSHAYFANDMLGVMTYLREYPHIMDRGIDLSKFHYDEASSDGDPFGDDSDPFDDGSSFSGGFSPFDRSPASKRKHQQKVSLSGKLISPSKAKLSKIQTDDWKKFELAVKRNPKEAEIHYLSLKQKSDFSVLFHIRVSTILYKYKIDQLARKVLSNIMAGEETSTVAQKRYLYWLMHFKEYDYALKKVLIFAPKLSNDDFKFIHYTLLTLTNRLEKSDLKKLAKIHKMSYHIDTLALMTPQLKNPPNYDIRIIASAESNGISEFIKTEYTSPIDPKLTSEDLYKNGYYSDFKNGIEEHSMKKAMPGFYQISVSNKVIATYRIEIYKHWNTQQQIKKVITLHTDGKGGWKKLHRLDFSLP